MTKEIELLIRKSALKDVELWLQEQYAEIDKELAKLAQPQPTKQESRKS